MADAFVHLEHRMSAMESRELFLGFRPDSLMIQVPSHRRDALASAASTPVHLTASSDSADKCQRFQQCRHCRQYRLFRHRSHSPSFRFVRGGGGGHRCWPGFPVVWAGPRRFDASGLEGPSSILKYRQGVSFAIPPVRKISGRAGPIGLQALTRTESIVSVWTRRALSRRPSVFSFKVRCSRCPRGTPPREGSS